MSWDSSTMVGLKMEPSDELRYIRKPSNVIACNIFAGVKKNTKCSIMIPGTKSSKFELGQEAIQAKPPKMT